MLHFTRRAYSIKETFNSKTLQTSQGENPLLSALSGNKTAFSELVVFEGWIQSTGTRYRLYWAGVRGVFLRFRFPGSPALCPASPAQIVTSFRAPPEATPRLYSHWSRELPVCDSPPSGPIRAARLLEGNRFKCRSAL